MLAPEAAWRRLRATRAHRPGLARRDEARGQVYVAALEQAEQLWAASERLGEASSPIVLYYSLIQALRGWYEAAVRNQLRKDPGHGLELVPPKPSSAPCDLRVLRVCDKGNRGFIQHVATALNSPTLANGSASLAALIASLPGSEEFTEGAPAADVLDAEPTPLLMRPGFQPRRFPPPQGTTNFISVVIEPTPRWLADAGPSAEGVDPPPVMRWLERTYPRLARSVHPGDVVVERFSDEFPPNLYLRWVLKPEQSTHEEVFSIASAPAGSTPTRPIGPPGGWVMPAVADNDDSHHPIIAWQCVLFATSMLARYQPALWTTMLRPDESRDAERIRHVLSVARNEIPVMVLREVEALDLSSSA